MAASLPHLDPTVLMQLIDDLLNLHARKLRGIAIRW